MAFPVDNTRVNLTGLYGPRKRILLSNGQWTSGFHAGVDLAPEVRGTLLPVYAVGRGTVHSVGFRSDAGRYIILRLSDNSLWRYAHLSSYGVKPGQTVADGQYIGRMGTTGNSTGVHLHIERYPNGQLVTRTDPWPYIKNEWNPAAGKAPAPAPAPDPKPAPAPAPSPALPPLQGADPHWAYTVQSGDSLGSIAARLGMQWQDIAALNRIKAPYVIHRGQILRVPPRSKAKAPAPAPATPSGPLGKTVRLASPWGKFRTYTDARRLRNQWGWFPAGDYKIIGVVDGQFKIQRGSTVGWINGQASRGII